MPFFPYFKLLFKLCQIGMTMKKKQSLERKQIDAEVYITDKEVEKQTFQSLMDNLAFHDKITDQVIRTQQEDIYAIVNKQDGLRNEIARCRNICSGNFKAEYFASLLA